MTIRERLLAKGHRWGVVALSLLAAALRLYGLGRQSLWSDEGFSVAVASVPHAVAWQALISDAVHPPLYYLLLRAVLALGRSEVTVRLPSALCGILSVPLLYAFVHRTTHRRDVSWLAALLLALSPLHIWYSQEARMYAPMVLFGLATMYAFVRAIEGDGAIWWGGLALTSGLAYGTHYFALFLPVIQFVFLMVTLQRHYPSLKTWVLIQALAFVPMAFWFRAIYSREVMSFGVDWIHPPTLADPLLTLWSFSLAYSGTLTPYVALGLALIGGALLYGLARRGACPADCRMLAGLWLALPIVVTLGLSFIVPMYIDRFLLISLPPYLILIACGIISPKIRQIRYLWGGLVILVSLISVVSLFTSPDFAKEDWRGLAQYLEKEAGVTDVIVCRQFPDKLPFEYYYRGLADRAVVTTNNQTLSLTEIAARHSRLWLIYRRRHESSHHLALSEPFDLVTDESDRTVLSWLEAHTGQLIEKTDRFPGLYLFAFRLESGQLD